MKGSLFNQKLVLFFLFFIIWKAVIGQIKIVSNSNPSIDLSGTTIDIEGFASDNEIAAYLEVVNVSGQPLNIHFQRVRILNSNRDDQICDENGCFTAEDIEVWNTPFPNSIANNDTSSFKPQIIPSGIESCAIHDYYVLDENDNKLDSIRIKFFTENANCELGVNKLFYFDEIKLFPNPAKSSINISTPTQSSGQFRIINLLGEEVYNAAFFGSSSTIDLTGFQNGIYLVQSLDSSNKPIATQKLIVNK